MTFDISAYTSAAVAGVPIVLVVVGLTQWIKGFYPNPHFIRGASMVVGLLLGGGFLLALNGFPVEFAGWFTVISHSADQWLGRF